MRFVVGIPARYGSSRFPGKPLALLAGRPMIAHVIERAKLAAIGPVFVATDDDRIAAAARAAGSEVVMTASHHQSGSERLAEAVSSIACDVVVNVQGDEPLIDPEAIRSVICPFLDRPDVQMATLAHPLRRPDDLHDPNVVKVVCNRLGDALYFSRAPIPFPRTNAATALQHVGLYAYRRDFLLGWSQLAPCPEEQAEQLEQLRVLHHGYRLAVEVGDFHTIGVDTPADLQRAENQLRLKNEELRMRRDGCGGEA